MTIVKQNIQDLIENWLKQEQEGIQFPVPFDLAWEIAGYSKKSNAKRKLTSKRSPLIEGEDYKTDKGFFIQSEQSLLSGRSSDFVCLTCDAFKHFCLMAETEQGRQIRQYFIEAEKKWRIVQEKHPQVAEDVEFQKLKLQSEVLDKQLQLRELDNSMTIMHGKEYVLTLRGHDDQLIEIERKTIEVIDEKHNVRFSGQTLTQIKEELKERFGLRFKSGAELKRYLEDNGMGNAIAQTKRSIVSDYVPTENLEELYQFLGKTRQQKLIGE